MSRTRTVTSTLSGFAIVTLLLVPAAVPQEPPGLNRLDPALSIALAKMQRLETAGRAGEIPLLARTAGVTEGPPGSREPWVEVFISGPGAESAVRMAGWARVSRCADCRWIADPPVDSAIGRSGRTHTRYAAPA